MHGSSIIFTAGAPSCFALHIPPAVHAAGDVIEGEIELNIPQLWEDEIEEVLIRLRGTTYTWITRGRITFQETVSLVDSDTSIWSRRDIPRLSPCSAVVRIPFRLALPDQLPPSFSCWTIFQGAHVRYHVLAEGVRKGALTKNKRHLIPIPVLPNDECGASVKGKYGTRGWKTFASEDKIRRGLWGEYSRVHVELALPDILSLPLFSDIPYAITVTTTTAPVSYEKSREGGGEGEMFPPVPRDPHEVEFELRRVVLFSAKLFSTCASDDVATILGGKKEKRPSAHVEVDLAERRWVPLDVNGMEMEDEREKGKHHLFHHHRHGEEGKMGAWVQRVTFRSTFRLNCAPTFLTDKINSSYILIIKVPFPGIGNSLKLEVPVIVTSGITKSLPRDAIEIEGPILDLPPAYWEAHHKDEGSDEKE